MDKVTQKLTATIDFLDGRIDTLQSKIVDLEKKIADLELRVYDDIKTMDNRVSVLEAESQYMPE
jgi:chaperonin cofactor prefoldin